MEYWKSLPSTMLIYLVARWRWQFSYPLDSADMELGGRRVSKSITSLYFLLPRSALLLPGRLGISVSPWFLLIMEQEWEVSADQDFPIPLYSILLLLSVDWNSATSPPHPTDTTSAKTEHWLTLSCTKERWKFSFQIGPVHTTLAGRVECWLALPCTTLFCFFVTW